MYSRAVHRGRRLSGLSCQRTSARAAANGRGSPSTPVAAAARSSRRIPAKAGRPNDARRPELPASKGMLGQCGRGGAARHGGSRQLRRPNDLLFGPQDNEVAAARARKLGVGLFPFALGGVCGVASEACRACPVRPRGLTSDKGVHCHLSQVCERQIICEDFDLTGGTERFMRESGTLTATGAPPSRQMRATARSMGAARARSTPVVARAARWSP